MRTAVLALLLLACSAEPSGAPAAAAAPDASSSTPGRVPSSPPPGPELELDAGAGPTCASVPPWNPAASYSAGAYTVLDGHLWRCGTSSLCGTPPPGPG